MVVSKEKLIFWFFDCTTVTLTDVPLASPTHNAQKQSLAAVWMYVCVHAKQGRGMQDFTWRGFQWQPVETQIQQLLHDLQTCSECGRH